MKATVTVKSYGTSCQECVAKTQLLQSKTRRKRIGEATVPAKTCYKCKYKP